MLKSLKPLLALLAANLIAAGPLAAQTDPYPSRAVRIIVPFGAGSTTDLVSRALAKRLSEQMGQSFVVENRPGAGGNIGTELAAKAPADGYTLLIGSNGPNAANPALYKSLPFEPGRDFVAVSYIGTVPMGIAASASPRVPSLSALIQADKARPGKANVGMQSTTARIILNELNRAASTQLQPVLYKASGQMITDVASDQIDMTIESLTALMPHVLSGKLRLLAVSTAARLPSQPNVPTIAESGAPGLEVVSWNIMFVPTGTPRPIVDRLNREAAKALEHPELRQQLQQLAYEPGGTQGVDELRGFFQRELERWGGFVRRANLTAE